MTEDRALHEAARATIGRIDEDRARVSSPEVKAVLQRIAEHLFAEDFSAAELRRSLGKQGKGIMAAFAAELGQRTSKYISGARLETSARLLRDTSLPVRQVGDLVGFRETTTFRSAFKRWFGLRPNEFRQATQRVDHLVGWPEDEILSLGFWDKVDREELPTQHGRRLTEWYRAVWSRVEEENKSPQTATIGSVDGGEELAKRVAEEVWEEVMLMPTAAQLHLLQHEILCGSPALFELLSKKSREEGRQDRQRGVEIAELALANVEASAMLLGLAFHELHPLALSRLGNAFRLAGDFPAAEKAFERAENAMLKAPRSPDLRVAAELAFLKGTLRLFQRRYDESEALLSHSIELSEVAGVPQMVLNSLLQRAAVLSHQERFDAAISDLHAVLKLLKDVEEPRLTLGVYQSLATSYAMAGDYTRAKKNLSLAQILCEELDEPVSRYQLQWVDGLIHLGQFDAVAAESLFQEARAGLLHLGQSHYAAEVSLDLAILWHEQGRFGEVADIVVSYVIPLFEPLRLDREALAALKLLREGVATKDVSMVALEKARAYLRSRRLDPVVVIRRSAEPTEQT